MDTDKLMLELTSGLTEEARYGLIRGICSLQMMGTQAKEEDIGNTYFLFVTKVLHNLNERYYEN